MKRPIALIAVLLSLILMQSQVFSQMPPPSALEPGVSQELAKWRAERYSDVRYKLNLTLEKMSPVLKGSIEIRLNVSKPGAIATGRNARAETRPVGSVPSNTPIILDWRKIRGHEEKSTITNVSINGKQAIIAPPEEPAVADKSVRVPYEEHNEHLIFRDGVVAGENVIKLDFTSPILTSGSAITRYIDKEDGSEYIYSLFVPSDASTAFPVFDQPDLKARFSVGVNRPRDWSFISNELRSQPLKVSAQSQSPRSDVPEWLKPPGQIDYFAESKPISTYVFAFAAGPFERVSASVSSPHVSKGSTQRVNNDEPSLTVGLRTQTTGGNPSSSEGEKNAELRNTLPTGRVSASRDTKNINPVLNAAYEKSLPDNCCGIMTKQEANIFREANTEPLQTNIYVRKSQAEKFKPHAAEVFRLNRESVKFFEEYFDYKFPFPKYDLVLIPEFPFGGMEHAGATFLRESSIIFPQEPTRNDHISRAVLIFHEAAHQWFGDTVTMKWFDDLWLKEGFANFAAYKALEKIMPEANAWKVFYERIKQGAYATDSTKGTTPIYQEIKNLSAAKSAYGNIVYNKAPAFLRQAEFYLGEDKFRTAVRSFLKKHEFKNATWEDLVKEFESASKQNLKEWASAWVKEPGVFKFRVNKVSSESGYYFDTIYQNSLSPGSLPFMKYKLLALMESRLRIVREIGLPIRERPNQVTSKEDWNSPIDPILHLAYAFPNHLDYGYGIFLLDEVSRERILFEIQYEKDPFLRSMMWGALWDSVREGELDPREYVELVVKVLQKPAHGVSSPHVSKGSTRQQEQPTPQAATLEDESTTALLLNRVATAMNYYIDDGVSSHVSKDSTQPETAGGNPSSSEGVINAENQNSTQKSTLPTGRVSAKEDSLWTRVEDMLAERLQYAPTQGQRITYYRAFLNIAASDKARGVLKEIFSGDLGEAGSNTKMRAGTTTIGGKLVYAGKPAIPVATKDKFDIVTRLLILGDPEAEKMLAELERSYTTDDAKRYAYAARAGIATAENKAKYWKDFTENKDISESWIEAAFGPWNSNRHSQLTLPYLERALKELPNHKRNRKIFFVNGWLGSFIGGQRSEEALNIINKFLAENPALDKDLRLKILENSDVIERSVNIKLKLASKK